MRAGMTLILKHTFVRKVEGLGRGCGRRCRSGLWRLKVKKKLKGGGSREIQARGEDSERAGGFA